MHSGGLILFIFSLLFPSGFWVHAECYYPDKSIVPSYQACNSTLVNGSACCELSTSVCTTEGFCIGNAGFMYRGGCTDPDWASPNCAEKCLNIAQGSFSNILPCSSGVYTEDFCCSDVPGTAAALENCCGDSFKFAKGNPYAPSPTVETSTSKVSGSSSTSTSFSTQSTSASTNKAISGTSAPSPIPSAHTASKSSTAMEIAIGVPLGLLLLLSMGFLFYRECQRQTMMESLKQEDQTKLSRVRQPHDGYPMVSTNPSPYELEHMHSAPGELESQSPQIYDAAAMR